MPSSCPPAFPVSGSSIPLDTLDFFRISPRGLAVTTPDPAVRRCVREGAVFLPDHSGGAAGKALIQTAERIVGFWDREIPESASRIRSRARELFEESERVGSSLNRGTSFA